MFDSMAQVLDQGWNPALDGWVPQLDGLEVQHDPGAVLDWVESHPADGYAAALLDAIDTRYLDRAGRLRLAAQWQRVEAAAAARKLAALDRYAADTDDTLPRSDFTDCAVAAGLTTSQPAAARLLRVARALTTRLPVTAARLRAGDTTYLAALAIVEAARDLTAEQCARYESLLWPACAGRTVGQVASQAERASARVDPARVRQRDRAARREAYLDVTTREDITAPHSGAGRIVGRGPVLDLTLISTAVEAWARAAKSAGDARSLDALRLAAFTEWATAYLHGDRPDGRPVGRPVGRPGSAAPTSHGSVCTINLGVSLETFLGLRDGVVEVLGQGTFLPAESLDELLPDAGLRRMLLDPMTGHLLDLSPQVYRPGAGFSRFVTLRDVTSAAPGSQVPAARAELDHNVAFDAGGPTVRANVLAVNKRWHDAKTRGGWTVVQRPDGTRTWTGPGGVRATTRPHDHRLGP